MWGPSGQRLVPIRGCSCWVCRKTFKMKDKQVWNAGHIPAGVDPCKSSQLRSNVQIYACLKFWVFLLAGTPSFPVYLRHLSVAESKASVCALSSSAQCAAQGPRCRPAHSSRGGAGSAGAQRWLRGAARAGSGAQSPGCGGTRGEGWDTRTALQLPGSSGGGER